MVSLTKRQLIDHDGSDDLMPADRPQYLLRAKPQRQIDGVPERLEARLHPDHHDAQAYVTDVDIAPDAQDKPSAQTSIFGQRGTVFLLVERAPVLQYLRESLRSAGVHTVPLTDYSELSRDPRPNHCACLIVGRCVAGMDGIIAQEIVQASNNKMPVIFITADDDVAFAVQVMLAGAVDVLPLLPSETELLEAVNNAFSLDEKANGKTVVDTAFSERFHTLTQRERQVMTGVVKGALNKQVAYALNLSVITVKMHRGSAMRKMGATTFADLVKMAGILGLLGRENNASLEEGATLPA